ncbi:hypothetical protein LIER_36463 [Lithospermum erythrorhizon]|uniref:Uncharacterized protein n=1 Tax=Lithospermum erythrorhizon TaxID=34254 RepID=A0AAV3P659_LITER
MRWQELAKPSSLPLGFQKGKNVSLPDWSLHIPHDESVLVIQKLDPDLCHLASGSGSTHDFDDQSMLDLRLHSIKTTNIRHASNQ